eukprot:2345758-Amphidinium_carterae.1
MSTTLSHLSSRTSHHLLFDRVLIGIWIPQGAACIVSQKIGHNGQIFLWNLINLNMQRWPRTPQHVPGQETVALVGAMPIVSPFGTPKTEAAGQIHQTVARCVEHEAEMRKVSNQHHVLRAEQMVRIRQSVALGATLPNSFRHLLALPESLL